jgi:hypothetical protein
LGLHIVPEFPPSEPYAFAVGPDGTLWIADRWKRRLAHFSDHGHYLGQISISTKSSGWLHDIEFLGTTLYAETDEHYGHMVEIREDGSLRQFAATSEGKPIFTEGFYPTPAGLISSTPGYTESLLGSRPQEGPFGYIRIDPSSGAVTPLPGLPTGNGDYFSMAEGPTGTFNATFNTSTTTTTRPITIRYSRDARHATSFSGGPAEFAIDGQDVLSFVAISASRPRNAFDGGRWLLRIGRSPLLWERLPMPKDGFDDSVQRRHIAVGPDGAIYLMLETRRGVEILRRP